MIEQTGVVIAIKGDLAEVQAQRQVACGGCAADGACGTSLVARYFGRKRSLLLTDNGIGARPGEQVVIGLPDGAMLEAAFVAYLLPLLAMIAGAMAGAYVAGLAAPAYTRALSVLAGLGGLAGALAWLVAFSRAKEADERYRARILRRIPQEGDGRVVRFQTPDLPGKQYPGSG